MEADVLDIKVHIKDLSFSLFCTDYRVWLLQGGASCFSVLKKIITGVNLSYIPYILP